MNATTTYLDLATVLEAHSYLVELWWWLPRLAVLAAVLLTYILSRTVLLRLIHAVVRRTSITFDDLLIEHKVFRAVTPLLPAIVFLYGANFIPEASHFIQIAVSIWVVAHLVILMDRLLSVGLEVYETKPIAMRRPLKGYIQLVKLFVYIVGGILIFSLLMEQSPWTLLSGLGALTAVLLIVFRDTILSFVASMQIAGNDVFRRGDWIEMPAFGADGEVIDVALHVVKVQNWDKTVVNIPTHKFMESGIRNWRGMQASGGRRIKRSLLIDQASIRFLDDAMLEKLKHVDTLYPYLADKELEIEAWNREHKRTSESLLNGRRQTNIGAFRAYVLEYLKNRKDLRQDMTLMVRQLQPSAEQGLPLEVYCFAATTAWVEYEAVQSDIFDHLLAALPEFGLRTYQRVGERDRRAQ